MDPLPLWIVLAYAFALGAVFGSFGNVLILRLPSGQSVGGRSHCPSCNRQLRLIELIPVLSFIGLRGRCVGCKSDISWFYPLIEAASGLLFVVAFSFLEVSLLARLLLGLCLWLLLIISVIDVRVQAIPDLLNIPLLVLAGLFAALTGRFDIMALALGLGFLGAQWILSGGRWLGSGDLFLVAAGALLLGSLPRLLVALVVAYGLGAVAAVYLLLTKKKQRGDSLAFGPFLSLGILCSLIGADLLLGQFYGL